MNPLNAVVTLLAVALLATVPATGAEAVRVVDGDTIVVGGITHRIHGIDALEFGQTRKGSSGKLWPCGKAALAEMEKLVLSSARVECDDRGKDGYGRPALGVLRRWPRHREASC